MADLLSKDMLTDLIINIVNILVLFFVTKALLYKPVKKFLNARREKTVEAVRRAEDSRAQADGAKAHYESLVEQTEVRKNEITADAQAKARQNAESIEAEARDKAQDIINEAQAEAKRIRETAISDSRAELTDAAIEISGKLLGRTVTDEDNKKIIDSFFA